MISRNIFASLFKSLLAAVFAVCLTVGTTGCSDHEGCCQGTKDKPCTAQKPCSKRCEQAKKAPNKPTTLKDAAKQKSNAGG